MNEKKAKTNQARFRNFVSIGYPESLNDDWQQKLAETHVPAIVSPLHDRDKNPDGEDKKAHYHIMLLFTGPKTMEQAQEVFDSLGAIKCQSVNSVRGEARYFLHLDNPEKEQYDIKDVKCFSGADISELVSLPSDRYGMIREILQFVKYNEIFSFSELLDWCAENKEDWFRALCDSCAYIVREHLKSRQYTLEHNLYSDTAKWKVPPKETGGEKSDTE